MDSPVGRITIAAEDGAITRLYWELPGHEGVRGGSAYPDCLTGNCDSLLKRAAEQVKDYFDGTRTDFDLPLCPAGSEFQKAVWDRMLAIPLGDTNTYGDIARKLGTPAQPVGQACGANPIPIIIPCHRVVASDGTLGGFSGDGGVETKVQLLKHEKAGSLLL